MIIINVKENESLDKAIKKFKKKFEKTGVVRELRERQAFTKPSINAECRLLKPLTNKPCNKPKIKI